MDAKTPLLSGVDAKDLAIGIQVQSQVGPNRHITMTLGVPMSMDLPNLNGFMDKIVSVLDRQNNMGILEQLKAQLEGSEKDLATHLLHRSNYEAKCANDWEMGNRKGEFRTTEAQKAQLANFDNTARELREVRIPKIKKEISDIERKLASE